MNDLQQSELYCYICEQLLDMCQTQFDVHLFELPITKQEVYLCQTCYWEEMQRQQEFYEENR